ncbi:CDP-glycerol glycerophosphotransferase family protein [Pseudoalteromonas shioyasakiensis]|uniref:CDP-glycerol glycerophosphotransferase family protein n=1 Tax=Pseudoalteromonas shioyasakiensis TaxID=1190813 RepID=UPI002118A5C1|nr:CDP-glycerol glycerophosphotransferase family protein [Pseudoalteromonas shioyasakiensis]MCQ8879953.1 CDP-glycerol glycerophosphotransferase family protein [Pseudoalteromonas shioyasakiensis]
MYISQNYSYAILRPLQQKILAQGGEVCWFLEGNEVTPNFLKANEQRLVTIDEVIRWSPDVSFIPGNVIPSFIPGIKVGLFHGFNSGKRNRRGFEDHFNIRGCFDLYCTQGPNTTTKFEQLSKQHKHFAVKETGWPTLDPLFSPNSKSSYSQPNDKRKTLLICSTFSRNLSLAPKLYQAIKMFSEQGKWRILVQFHPKMPSELVTKYQALENTNLTFIETDNVLPLLKAADVMLCDTSSILLMFILQRKPVVTFCNQAPGNHLINVTDPNKVEAAIEFALTHPPQLMDNIESFCQQLHPYQDGLSSERVLAASNELLLTPPPLKPKPLNLIRNLKMRKKLKYWRW